MHRILNVLEMVPMERHTIAMQRAPLDIHLPGFRTKMQPHDDAGKTYCPLLVGLSMVTHNSYRLDSPIKA